MAGALLLGFCVAAYPKSTTTEKTTAGMANQCDNPGEVLKKTLEISAGGPYVAKVGVPITLHGTYSVEGLTEDNTKLRTIAQALQSYLKDHGTYPPGALLNAKGQRTVGWRVLILPYLGETALYERFDLAQPWNDPVNLRLLCDMPDVYRKSDADRDSTDTGFAGAAGTNTIFATTSTALNGGLPATGASQNETIAAGPVGQAVHLPWTAPEDIDTVKVPQLGSANGFSGADHTFTPLVFLDGSIHLVPNNVGTGPVITWTQLSSTTNVVCRCTPPSSIDAGINATWDLGENGTFNTDGWDVTFLAARRGKYTVTLHATDHFGGEYKKTATVEVR